jgi:hypothetical protein
MFVEPQPDLNGNVEQDPRAQRSSVWIFDTKATIVVSGTDAERKEDVRRHLILPAHISISVISGTYRIHSAADCRSQHAAKEWPERRKENLDVDVERSLFLMVAEDRWLSVDKARVHVMRKGAQFEFG